MDEEKISAYTVEAKMENWSDSDWARVLQVRRYRRIALARTCIFAALTLSVGIWVGQSSGIGTGLLATAATAGICRVSYLALSIMQPFGSSDGPAGGSGRPVRPTSTPPVLSASAARQWPEI